MRLFREGKRVASIHLVSVFKHSMPFVTAVMKPAYIFVHFPLSLIWRLGVENAKSEDDLILLALCYSQLMGGRLQEAPDHKSAVCRCCALMLSLFLTHMLSHCMRAMCVMFHPGCCLSVFIPFTRTHDRNKSIGLMLVICRDFY